jgi:hypothetical protein
VFYAIIITAPSQNNALVGFLGALLGGIITLAPFFYINFVANPYLEIIWRTDKKYDDIHRPSMTTPLRKLSGGVFVERKHIRVIIKNNGRKVAKSCCATIQKEENGSVDGCIAFSREPKSLKWVTPLGNTEVMIDIAPYGGEQYLEVVFADNRNSWSPVGGNCKIDNNQKAPLWAYASTPPAYELPSDRNQDGFCRGRFRVDMTVYSGTAKPCRKKFELNITDKWQISMSDSE